jgi:hypothetical protein
VLGEQREQEIVGLAVARHAETVGEVEFLPEPEQQVARRLGRRCRQFVIVTGHPGTRHPPLSCLKGGCETVVHHSVRSPRWFP